MAQLPADRAPGSHDDSGVRSAALDVAPDTASAARRTTTVSAETAAAATPAEPDVTVHRRGAYRHTTERRRKLVELIGEQQGIGNVQHLAERLGVSPSTVRRDLAQLQDEQRIARTYGGVIDPGRLDRSWRVKSSENLGVKRAIARAAVARVVAGETVLLDSGTTVAEAAGLLGDRNDVQLVTNGLSSILALADTSADVMVLGGRLRRPSESLVGVTTLQSLERLTVDVAFLGAEALDAGRGINCPEMDQAAAKELMVQNAREAWVLVDASKLSRAPAFAYWARVIPDCGILTDASATPEQLAPFRDAGWRVEIA